MYTLNVKIDPGYKITENVSECFAHYFGNGAPSMLQWMQRNEDVWNPIDAVNKTSSENFISSTILTSTQPITCNITVSKSATLFYNWQSPIIQG